MDRLGTLFRDKELVKLLKEDTMSFLHERSGDAVLAGKDITGYREARDLLDAFLMYNIEKYAPKKERRVDTPE